MTDTTRAIEGERSIGLFMAEPQFIRGEWHAQIRDPHQPTEAQRLVAMSLDRNELEELLAMIDEAEASEEER